MSDRPAENSQWSDADWANWFNDEVVRTEAWSAISPLPPTGEPKSDRDIVKAMVYAVSQAGDIGVAVFFFSSKADRGDIFSHQTPADRYAFYNAWTRYTSPDADSDPPDDSPRDLSRFEMTVTMPDGSKVTVEGDGVDRSEKKKRKKPEPRKKLAVGVVGILVALGGTAVVISSGDSDAPTPVSEPPTEVPEESASVDSSSSDSSADAPADVPADEPVADPCVARREEQIVLDVYSPDFSSGVTSPGEIVEIPIGFTATGEGGNQEGLTPRFEWSEVPPETDEIAIFIGSAPEEPWEEYRDTENIYDQLIPLSAEWMLAGLPASATALGQTSLSIAPPEGSIELGHPFVGASFPESRFIFGVVALCNRDVERVPSIGALKSDAIAVGQFLASPDW